MHRFHYKIYVQNKIKLITIFLKKGNPFTNINDYQYMIDQSRYLLIYI